MALLVSGVELFQPPSCWSVFRELLVNRESVSAKGRIGRSWIHLLDLDLLLGKGEQTGSAGPSVL